MTSFDLSCLSETRMGTCRTCDVPQTALLLCPCGKAKYCSTECQADDWARHQSECPYGMDYVESQVCSGCLSTGGQLSCSCGTTFYCNQTCQNRHWKEHQHICKSRIRVLLREATRMMVHVGVQCRIKKKKSVSMPKGPQSGASSFVKVTSDGDAQNPLKKNTSSLVRAVDFDASENSDRSGVNTSNNNTAVSFVAEEGENSDVEMSSGEDMDIVEQHTRKHRRSAAQVAKLFVRNVQVLSNVQPRALSTANGGDGKTIGFGADGEANLSSESDESTDGGANNQPPRKKIGVAIYIDMDEVKTAKKAWMNGGAQQKRKIVRRGMIMC